jgi:hypothetical protein
MKLSDLLEERRSLNKLAIELQTLIIDNPFIEDLDVQLEHEVNDTGATDVHEHVLRIEHLGQAEAIMARVLLSEAHGFALIDDDGLIKHNGGSGFDPKHVYERLFPKLIMARIEQGIEATDVETEIEQADGTVRLYVSTENYDAPNALHIEWDIAKQCYKLLHVGKFSNEIEAWQFSSVSLSDPDIGKLFKTADDVVEFINERYEG